MYCCIIFHTFFMGFACFASPISKIWDMSKLFKLICCGVNNTKFDR